MLEGRGLAGGEGQGPIHWYLITGHMAKQWAFCQAALPLSPSSPLPLSSLSPSFSYFPSVFPPLSPSFYALPLYSRLAYIIFIFWFSSSHLLFFCFWLPEEAAGRLRCGVCRLTFDVALKLRQQQRQQLASNFTKCHTDNEPLEQRPRRATKIVPARADSLSAIWYARCR